jgi:hypothetical protein
VITKCIQRNHDETPAMDHGHLGDGPAGQKLDVAVGVPSIHTT